MKQENQITQALKVLAISPDELAKQLGVSTGTLGNWKTGYKPTSTQGEKGLKMLLELHALKQENASLKEKLETREEAYTTEKYLESRKIKLMGNFGIHFLDIEDYSVGAYAEDTVYMIINIAKSDIKVSEIDERLETLKEWNREETK